MVQSWILNGLTSELSEAFLYSENAHALWTELEESFNIPSGFLLYELYCNLRNGKQGQDSVVTYYIKFMGALELISKLQGNHSLLTHNHLQRNIHLRTMPQRERS